MSKKQLAIIAGVILVAVAAVIGVVVVVNNKDKKESSGNNTSQDSDKNDDNEEEELDETEIEEVQASLEDVKSFEGTIDLNISMLMEFNESFGIENQSLSMESTGEIKQNKKENGDLQLYIDQTIETMGTSSNIIQIIDGKTLYVNNGQGFEKIDLSDTNSPEYAQYGSILDQQYLADIASAQEFKLVGEEEVNGVMTNKYEVVVDNQSAMETIKSQLGGAIDSLKAIDASITEDDISYSFDFGKSYIWLSQDELLPVKQESQDMKATIEVKDYFNVQITDMSMTLVYENVNEDVDIEIPEV